MRLSDRYVFAELVLPFVIGTLAVLMMLVGNTLFAYLARMLQEKWPVGVVARALVLNIPTVLVLTLPVATALAASLATNRMARDLEITVLRGSGASLRRIFLPMLVFGALVGAANFYISDRVVPWAWKEQQNIEAVLYSLPKDPIQSNVAFKVENYAFYIGSVQRTGSGRLRLTKVVILRYPERPDQYPEITTAQTAEYYADLWTLKDVVVHFYDKNGVTIADGASKEAKLPLRVNFSQVLTPPLREDQLSFAELTERAADARRLGQTQDARRYEVERWFKISLPAMCLAFALCAPPLALRFSRAGSFTGVLLSIIVVFVAWNTLLFMRYVGWGGFLPAPVAAWSPNVLFTLLGLWLLRVQE
jgi:lipopolysaccharide export system permease protein